MVKTPIFKGSCTAIVTPYGENGIDYTAMARLIEQQYEGGTAALVVCGTTGENATQQAWEHDELVDFCVKRTNGRMKIIVGVGSNNTQTALKFAENAKHAGADGILMVTPYYNKTTQAGLVKHFSYVADRVDIPMILYNVPSRTGIGISAATYKELSEHPNINGVKEASGDMTLFATARAMCGNDLYFWSGNDDNTVPMMAFGALGVISVASNIIPSAVAMLCRKCLEGDFIGASEIYCRYADLYSKLFIETNPIPVKTAMNLMGLGAGVLRLPLTEMSPGNLNKLKVSMKEAGLIIRE